MGVDAFLASMSIGLKGELNKKDVNVPSFQVSGHLSHL